MIFSPRATPVVLVAGCLLAPAMPSWGAEAAYPVRPVRVIVPFPAGSATDLLARILGQKLSLQLGQNMLVDNRGGGSGSIGALAAARAVPDGHTLILGGLSMLVVAPAVNPNVGYVLKDFAPITNVVMAPYVLVVSEKVAVNNVKDLIALARARPGQLSYASAGSGSLAHLAGELFSLQAGIRMTHVPYKTSAQSVVDVANGNVQVLFGTLGPTLPFIQGGRLRVLGVTGRSRLPALPDAPAISETALPDYDVVYWLGMLAPAATPKSIISRLNAEIHIALGARDIKEALAAQGLEPAPTTPQAFARLLDEDAVKWRQVIKAAGVRGD